MLFGTDHQPNLSPETDTGDDKSAGKERQRQTVVAKKEIIPLSTIIPCWNQTTCWCNQPRKLTGKVSLEP